MGLHMSPPYCSLPSSQAPCNHSHACPLILASNRYFLQYHSNRHIHVQSTWAWHGVTQHSHCARMSIRKVAARVMLSPLVFALHYTISHIECVTPYLICLLRKPHSWSDGCRKYIRAFFFLGYPPDWHLSSMSHQFCQEITLPPPRYATNAMPVDLHSGISTIAPIVVHLIRFSAQQLASFGRALSNLPEDHDSVTNLSWFATLHGASHADFNVD